MLPRPSKQIKLDFDKLTRKDLKPVIDSFIKAGLDVYEVEATNKGKRETGILVKSFSFTFKDGQTLQVRIKVDGVIFQCKINKKTVPIIENKGKDKAIGKIDISGTEFVRQIPSIIRDGEVTIEVIRRLSKGVVIRLLSIWCGTTKKAHGF